MDPYQNLANAIIVSAAREYKLLLRKLGARPNNVYLIQKLERIEDFFHSDWFGVLSDTDGPEIIRKLRSSLYDTQRKRIYQEVIQ